MSRSVILGIGICALGSMLAAGCATVTLPQGPDIYSLALRLGAVTLVVPKPEDQRVDKGRIGHIGATQYSLKADPTELIAKEVIAALYAGNINGVLGQLHAADTARFAQAIQAAQADGLLALSVKSISIKSLDILMDPPTAEVMMEAALYDRQGKLVDTVTVTGHVQRRIGAFSFEKDSGKLLAEAARDAGRRLTSPGGFRTALSKLASSETEEN